MKAAVERAAGVVTEHSWAVVAAMLVATAVLGAGLGAIEESSTVSGLSDDSRVVEAYGDARTDFTTRDANTTTTLIAVGDEEGNVLSKDSLVRTLRYQRALRDNETLGETLADEQGTVSVANVIARAAMASEDARDVPEPVITDWNGSSATAANATAGSDGGSEAPSLEEQIDRLESMDESAVEATVERVLDPESTSAASRAAYRLLPREYEPGSTNASAHLVLVTQETDGQVRAAAAISERVSAGQQAARSIAVDRSGPESYYVYSRGLVSPQQSAAMSSSLGILGPLALAFVLFALTIAYRDPVDVVLGLVGVGVVLVWTLGSLGWLGIAFNQTMIAVPILLIGLSVDYALHVVMRYREERTDRDDGVRAAMRRSLTGVGPALVLVTTTTAIGFLANLTSSFGDIRAFGLVTAIGIVATLFVFGLLVPALKTIVASFLGRFGLDRTPSVLGAGGAVERFLGGGAAAARRAPLAVVAFAILLSAGGAYGATTVDVATPQTAFMADDTPDWAEGLPGAPDDDAFFLKENREYVYSKFQAPDKQGFVLVEGDVTAPETLAAMADAERAATRSDAVFESPDGEPEVVTPLTAMREAAASNPSFRERFEAADGDGDGVPDRNLAALYDAYYESAPDLATRTLHRTDDGEYTAARLRIATEGNADRSAAVAPIEAAAAAFDGTDLRAVATGQPVISKNLNDGLATTVIESLSITLLVILALLTVVFRLTNGSASLGALTILPVAFSVSWILGTMALLDIPIGLITAMVGSLSVGLGVDYAIHVSERFAEEYEALGDAERALSRTVTGTGSALFSSAVTTAAGFGVLSFSLLPALRQFGFILAVGIVFSFLATVFVQPSLLALWDRHGPSPVGAATTRASTADD